MNFGEEKPSLPRTIVVFMCDERHGHGKENCGRRNETVTRREIGGYEDDKVESRTPEV